MAEDVKITLDPNLKSAVAELVGKMGAALPMARMIADTARSLAPVESGRYRDGISVQQTKTGARVLAADQKSSWIEFGIPSHHQAPQFVLRRAVDACGLKFAKGRKPNG